MSEAARVVVLDTSVLVNVLILNRLDLFERLSRHHFVVPSEVSAEVVSAVQATALAAAFEAQILEQTSVLGTTELTAYATLKLRFGRGESACIAIAEARGSFVALDDKRALKEAKARLGNRLYSTAGLLFRAIQEGLLGIDEADELMAVLEANRFKMPFDSFASLFKEK